MTVAPSEANDSGKGGITPLSVAPPTAIETGIDLANVLKEEEETRARIFFRVVGVLAFMVDCFVPFLPGVFWFRVAAGTMCGLAVLMSLVGLYKLAKDAYTPVVATAMGVTAAILGVGVMNYIGLFSAGVMVLALGIFFFGMSHSRMVARTTYASIAGLYGIGSVLVASNTIPDLSLFPISGVEPFARWYQVIMSQVVLGVTFYLARSSRRATENALIEVNRFNVQLQKRDALLSEARRELDRALKPGDGRHSGETVGAYRLGEILGRGGMGEVYRAEHVQSKVPAAVKLLHPNLLENPDHVKRFLREAEAAASVQNENVVQVIETGTTSSGAPFLAMELLEGHDLGWHLRKTGRLSLPAVVELVEQVARALAVLRDAGVVHRDLKPANLFLTDSIPRKWKVLDFGLSKILGGHTLTRDQAIGTPAYMAPEQVIGKNVDHQTDLYSVASLAYRAITGSPPFSGDEVAHILFKVLYSQPASPASLVKLPVDVELVIAIGMAKRRTDRFPFVEEFAGALRLAAEGELDDETRAKGWALVKEFPWGSSRSPKKGAA